MRITVGHILLLLMLAGGLFYFKPVVSRVHWADKIPDRVKTWGNDIKSMIGIIQEDKALTIAREEQPVLPPIGISTGSGKGEGGVESAAKKRVPGSVAKKTAPAKKGKIRPRPKRKTRKTRRPNKTKRAAKLKPKRKAAPKKAATSPQPPPSTAPHEEPTAKDLMGTFVSLELNTGRKVRGILKKTSPAAYTIQLPGVGSFDYPVDKVKNIESAE